MNKREEMEAEAAVRRGGENAHPTSDMGEGMTIRESYAQTALQGLLARDGDHVDGSGDPQRWSELAVKYADALLLELQR